MDFEELKLLLKSSETRNITKALLQIRTTEVKSQSGLQHLLDQNLVSYLIPILNRSNQKNIDITLSILGNLLQSSVAQVQIRQCSGLNKLVNILDNIQDRNKTPLHNFSSLSETRRSPTNANRADRPVCNIIEATKKTPITKNTAWFPNNAKASSIDTAPNNGNNDNPNKDVTGSATGENTHQTIQNTNTANADWPVS